MSRPSNARNALSRESASIPLSCFTFLGYLQDNGMPE